MDKPPGLTIYGFRRSFTKKIWPDQHAGDRSEISERKKANLGRKFCSPSLPCIPVTLFHHFSIAVESGRRGSKEQPNSEAGGRHRAALTTYYAETLQIVLKGSSQRRKAVLREIDCKRHSDLVGLAKVAL